MKVEVNDKTVAQMIGLIPKENLIKYLKEVLKNEERGYRSSSVFEYLLGSKPFKTAADFPLDGESSAKIAECIWDKDADPTSLKVVDVINIEDTLIVEYKRQDGTVRRTDINVEYYDNLNKG